MEAAHILVEFGDAPPTQARLRRAVSTGYYAMFHTLAASLADLFIGKERSPAWHRAYRALDHGRARTACRQGQAMQEFPAEIRDFAEAFVVLQRARRFNMDIEQDQLYGVEEAVQENGRLQAVSASARARSACSPRSRTQPAPRARRVDRHGRR